MGAPSKNQAPITWAKKRPPCRKKNRFPSEAAATSAANAIAKANGQKAMRAYRCSSCKRWHLTRQEKRG